MSVGTTYSPAVPMGWATSYKLWPMFTYGKWLLGSVQTFSGGFLCLGGDFREGVFVGGYFHGETCHGGREFQ